jgi:RimJ/RimL family protein N-acetyltransferase
MAKIHQTLETMHYMTSQLYSLETSRLLIRQLSDQDIIDDYLSWMQNMDNSFIQGVDPNITKKDLYNYINEKNSNPDSLLLGIFDKETNLHIGNGKFEPINYSEKFAVMGLFIGNINFRGKGLSKEFIDCCKRDILLPMGIKKIILGVKRANVNAVKAYNSAGFVLSKSPCLDLGHDSIQLDLKIGN